MYIFLKIELISYLSWQMLLISKLSPIIGMINSIPGSESKVTFIFEFFLYSIFGKIKQGVVKLLSKTDPN